MSLQKKFIKLKKYEILYPIGCGAFSDVYLIKNKVNVKYYAAKVSHFMVDEDTKDEKETLAIFREVNLISLLDHPCILKFIGYSKTDFEENPKPTIITEYASNGSLYEIIEMEKSGLSPDEWNPTKKLIAVYGIACGMSYLHSNKIIHRDMKTQNILLNEFLHPKISDFGLSKINEFISTSMNIQSQKGLNGTPIYMAPEIFLNEEYSEASDVYAFSIILFELFTLEDPYKNFNFYSIIQKVGDGYRPQINKDIPDFFKDLIEKCWSQEPKNRPTFAQIVDLLKNNDQFINELIDESEFLDYIDYIDSCGSTFNLNNRLVHFDDFVKVHGRKKDIKKIYINTEIEEEQSEADILFVEEEEEIHSQLYNSKNDNFFDENQLLQINDQHELINSNKINEYDYQNKINEYDDLKKTKEEEMTENNNKYPFYKFYNLDKDSQKLIEEAEFDVEKQYKVAVSFFEGKNNFPINISLGKQYLQNALFCKDLDSIIYYIKILIKGKVIQQNLEKAKHLINNYLQEFDQKILLGLKGYISKKEKKYSKASKYFKNGAKLGDIESMYEYGKFLFKGQGILKNDKKAFKYFNLSAKNGFQKSSDLVTLLIHMNKIKEFKKLNPLTQLILVNKLYF